MFGPEGLTAEMRRTQRFSVLPSPAFLCALGVSAVNVFTVAALSAGGLYISLYFTLVYYGVLPAENSFVPAFCSLKEQTCQSVLNTRFARVFGVPNSLLGVVYYVVILVLLFAKLLFVPVLLGALVVVAWFTVALGIYLAYSLFFIIKTPCPLCLASHAINLALALLLMRA